jgi:hypothetical protein
MFIVEERDRQRIDIEREGGRGDPSAFRPSDTRNTKKKAKVLVHETLSCFGRIIEV